MDFSKNSSFSKAIAFVAGMMVFYLTSNFFYIRNDNPEPCGLCVLRDSEVKVNSRLLGYKRYTDLEKVQYRSLVARKALANDPELVDFVRKVIDPPGTSGVTKMSRPLVTTPQATEVDRILGKQVCHKNELLFEAPLCYSSRILSSQWFSQCFLLWSLVHCLFCISFANIEFMIVLTIQCNIIKDSNVIVKKQKLKKLTKSLVDKICRVHLSTLLHYIVYVVLIRESILKEKKITEPARLSFNSSFHVLRLHRTRVKQFWCTSERPVEIHNRIILKMLFTSIVSFFLPQI